MSAPSDPRVRAIHALCMDALAADPFGRPGDALQELGVNAARLAATSVLRVSRVFACASSVAPSAQMHLSRGCA
jgi:hypothetical protein